MAAMLKFYTAANITLAYKSICIYNCRILTMGELVILLSHKFVLPACC